MPELSQQDPQLDKLSRWQAEAKNLTQTYVSRWAKNEKLVKGIFQDNIDTKSKVRDVKKIFFRKIWATLWRLLSSFYNAYLRDYDNFKIEGRDTESDPQIARVLHFMTQYHRDRMIKNENLFLKFIWSFQNIIKFGLATAKFYWNTAKDRPEFCIYPPEQVFLDLAADDATKMRYAFFLNYMTKDEMEEEGYENIDKCVVSGIESSELRGLRHNETPDPLQNYTDTTDYSSWVAGGLLGGTYSNKGVTEGRDSNVKRYKVYECFWKEKGQILYGITCDFQFWLKRPVLSPYGERFPLITGTCLTEPHKIIGEGFPEPLESPQESYNYILNMRKDNIALSMSGHTFVSRYANVDLQSLTNRRTGGYTLMDDVNAVKHEQMPDVTSSAYVEANADDLMMQEMSGITAGKEGMETAEKATVAQINFTESNAKVDLFIAIVGETFMRDFYSMLAYLIAKFETDMNVFRIANEKLKKESPDAPFIYDIDIDADCIISIGAGTTGRDIEIKQILLAIDRSMMANQATGQLLQLGVIKPENALFINTSEFIADLLPMIGRRDLKRYFIKAQPPMQQEGAGGMSGGASQPQIGDLTMPAEANMVQSGSTAGGI